MKFSHPLLSSLLLATAALARPSLESRLARRANRNSRPIQRIDSDEVNALTNATHAEFSSNWAGAVFEDASVSTLHRTEGTVSTNAYLSSGYLQVCYGNLCCPDAEVAWRLWLFRCLRLGWY